MEKNSENLNHELKIINDRWKDLEDRLYRERNLRKRVEKDLHELEKNMQDSSESDSSSSDDDSPPDTDRGQSKDRSSSKRHKKNSHKGKPCYERQHSSKNSSDKPTERSRHDGHDSESRTVTNPYLEKAQEYLEQYSYGDEEEKILRDKSTPRLKSKDKVEQRGNVLANVFDDGADNVDPTRPNVCNSFLNKGACLQPGCKYLHFRPDIAYPSYGYRKGHSNKSYGHSLANVSGSGPSRPPARKSNKTCFQYSKTGHCRFGFRCRFQHVRENSHSQWPIENEHNHVKTGYNYPLPGVNFASFLGEMRNVIARTVRDTLGLVEVQHQNLPQNVSHTQNSTQQFMHPPVNQGQHLWPVQVATGVVPQ